MESKNENQNYCTALFERKRRVSREIKIGNLLLGGKQPVRLQSMTTYDTMDTENSVNQSIRMINEGCELVRLTAPSIKDAKNLGVIKEKLVELGYNTPLVADIHFTPNAADVAAALIEKVRINPGNYADKKKFAELTYTNESYQEELDRIEKKFTPFIELCKQNNTAIRIGTNHGSLSDRILGRFGDTPEGMVESAMEFIRICNKNDFHNVVISMKASNTLVMVQAYRLLIATMNAEEMTYPLHLGVTEAGDGEDGRIKSAVGIGALLEDGIGDTIRVSLTEAPEKEIPVARKLVEKFDQPTTAATNEQLKLTYDPFSYKKRNTTELNNIGGKNVPVVIGSLADKSKITPANLFAFGYNYSVELDKWNISDQAIDYIFIGDQTIDFELPGTLGVVCSLANWSKNYSNKSNYHPIVPFGTEINGLKSMLTFQTITPQELDKLTNDSLTKNTVLVLDTSYENSVQLLRKARIQLDLAQIKTPIIFNNINNNTDTETFQLNTSSCLGINFIDGFGDGIFLQGKVPNQLINSTAFGILQATRTRISKTEYISCPSCGRTLFDLQETTAKIREKTSHLKGLKIGIMGCIVNGPGEMADADYGYVGTGPGKIHLYKEQEVVRKNISEKNAVGELIELIKENGDWIEPKA